jgi:3',5'-cyclic AMP phosphodiesterase CpdA
VTIAVAADIHFGDEDVAALAAFKAFADARNVALVVLAGDLTYAGATAEFARARAWIAALGRPVVATPGNHDVPLWNPVARFAAPFARYDATVGDAAGDGHEGADFAVTSLNSARGAQWRLNWAWGVVTPAQARAAADRLDGAGARARIVVCHHPLVSPPDSPLRAPTAGGPEAARIMADGGVDIVVSGHLHHAFVQQLPGGDGRTWGVGAGTLSRRLRGAPPGFVTLDRADHGAAVTIWDVIGGQPAARPPVAVRLRR